MEKYFLTLDTETLGTPDDCGTTHIVMPSAAFVVWRGLTELPYILYACFNTAEQMFQGAKVSAGTIAFWMKEAEKNPAAKEIIRILDSNTSTLQMWGWLSEGKVEYHNNNGDLFGAISGAITANNFDELHAYGNGPDFDMTIYSANAFHSNDGKAQVPWEFWNVRSARNAKEQTEDFKSLMKSGNAWAVKVMEDYNMYRHSHTPSKHNPIYDALVESYIIAHTLEK